MITERKKFLINATYFFSISAIVFFVIKFLLKYLLPFLLAFLVSIILHPLCEKVSKKFKIKSIFSSFICVLTFYFLLLFFVFGITFLLIKLVESFYKDVPYVLESFISVIEEFYGSLEINMSKMPQFAADFVGGFFESVKGLASETVGVKISSVVGYLAQKTPSFLFSFIVMFISTFYFVKDYNKLVNFAKEILPNRVFLNSVKIKKILIENVLKISLSYLLLGLITFAELIVCFLIFRIKKAFILALIISLIDLLPVLGAGIVLIPWAVILFLMGKVSLGIKLLVIYLCLTVVRNFLEPKIIGKQTGIGPLLTLIVMFAGLKTMGVFGAIVLPIVVTVLFSFYRTQ